jgi:hypothetical protein
MCVRGPNFMSYLIGKSHLVVSDWDLAPKCVRGPNFKSYLIGKSPILSATSMCNRQHTLQNDWNLVAKPALYSTLPQGSATALREGWAPCMGIQGMEIQGAV